MSKLFKEQPIPLYHYSTERYPELTSLAGRGLQKDGYESKKEDPFAYNKSISFFFEPIPLDLPSILHHKHEFWKTGTRLYQYLVYSSQIPKKTPYRLTEGEEVIDLIYNKQNWDNIKGNDALIQQYKEEIKTLEAELKYIGTDVDDLVRVSKKYQTGIMERYKKLYDLSLKYPEDNLLDKYAATVPHVMLYVNQLRIKPKLVTEIKLR